MRASAFVFRLGVTAVIALATVRAAGYLLYVVWIVAFPLEIQALEAVMVHHSWRVLTGLPLYPDWETYPHVTNFFTPMYFWLVGSLGRATRADIPQLFVIGRAVTFLSTLAATACLAWYLRARHGTQAACVGALLSLPPAPLYGFALMTRPDAMADSAGVVGFLLTRLNARKAPIVGAVLLAVAILTKQTAALYLLAAILGCLAEGRYRRAFRITAVSIVVLALACIILTTSSGPLFLKSIVQEGQSPLSAVAWMRVAERLATLSPELLIVSVAGLVWWYSQNERGMFVAMATLLAGSLLTAFKVGADLNYFLPLRTTCALAAGTLWAAAHRSFRERAAWITAATAGAVLVMMPGAIHAVAGARQAHALSSYIASASGAPLLETYRSLIGIVQAPNLRVLTDSALLALYQKERAPFTDPWLFRLLVETGRIRPRHMEQSLESGSYDLLVLTADLNSRRYDGYDFGLPPFLVRQARARYQRIATAAGFFIYRPRPPS